MAHTDRQRRHDRCLGRRLKRASGEEYGLGLGRIGAVSSVMRTGETGRRVAEPAAREQGGMPNQSSFSGGASRAIRTDRQDR